MFNTFNPNNTVVVSTTPSWWNWIVATADKIEGVIATDVEKAVKDIRNEVADYLDKHAETFATKISEVIAMADSEIETAINSEIKKTMPMVQADIEAEVDQIVVRVLDKFSVDKATEQAVIEQLNQTIGKAVAKETSQIKQDIDQALEKIKVTACAKAYSDVVLIMRELADKIRG